MVKLRVCKGVDYGRSALFVEGDGDASYRLTPSPHDFRFTLVRIVGESEAAYGFALGLIREELRSGTLSDDVRELLTSLPPAHTVDWPAIRGDVPVRQLITWGDLDHKVYERLRDAGVTRLRDLDDAYDRYRSSGRETGIPGVGWRTVMRAWCALSRAYLLREYHQQDPGQDTPSALADSTEPTTHSRNERMEDTNQG